MRKPDPKVVARVIENAAEGIIDFSVLTALFVAALVIMVCALPVPV